MYFESQIHEKMFVASLEEATDLIKVKGVASYKAICYNDLVIVADHHCDSPWAETAVLKNVNGAFYQVDSITVAWIKNPVKLTQYFIEALTASVEGLSKKSVPFVGDNMQERKANFSCGCCGVWFRSTIAKQEKFNQDSGYGICPDCEKYYS